MKRDIYFQPDTCVPGQVYYIESTDSQLNAIFRKVKFVDYRPHPAEVIIKDGSKFRVIRRIDLYQMNGGVKSGKIVNE